MTNMLTCMRRLPYFCQPVLYTQKSRLSTSLLSKFKPNPSDPLVQPFLPWVMGQDGQPGTESAQSVFTRKKQPVHLNVLITFKPHSKNTRQAFLDLCRYLHSTYPHLNMIVEPETHHQYHTLFPFLYTSQDTSEYERVVDFAITLGGDGTLLHYASLFPQRVPPVMSFSLGSLGFLLPFEFQHYQKAIHLLIEGQVSILQRMRLECHFTTRTSTLTRQALNEVVFHRASEPHMSSIDCWVDDSYLTGAISDGLIISTPSGSTAYNLSAGGPIVHPSVSSMLLTPICPRSLSFRPMLLPAFSEITLQLSPKSRGLSARVAVDGRDAQVLHQHDRLIVKKSKFPVPCVDRSGPGVPSMSWYQDINAILKWNQSFSPVS